MSYEIIYNQDGFKVYVHLINGEVARLITKLSYNPTLAVIKKIECKASESKFNPVINIDFVQVHQDH